MHKPNPWLWRHSAHVPHAIHHPPFTSSVGNLHKPPFPSTPEAILSHSPSSPQPHLFAVPPGTFIMRDMDTHGMSGLVCVRHPARAHLDVLTRRQSRQTKQKHSTFHNPPCTHENKIIQLRFLRHHDTQNYHTPSNPGNVCHAPESTHQRRNSLINVPCACPPEI